MGGENVIPNSGFEFDTLNRGLPDGWRRGYSTFHPEKYSGRSIFTIYKGTYGMRYWSDFIPLTSRYCYIPILPRHADKEVLSLFKNIVREDQFEYPEEARKYFNQYYPEEDKTEGFVLKLNDALYATSTYLNSDKTEHLDVEFVNLRWVADLKSNNYILAKKKPDGIRVLLDNRDGWNSELNIYSDRPLKIIEERGKVLTSWDNTEKILKIKVNHKLPTAVVFKIVEE